MTGHSKFCYSRKCIEQRLEKETGEGDWRKETISTPLTRVSCGEAAWEGKPKAGFSFSRWGNYQLLTLYPEGHDRRNTGRG